MEFHPFAERFPMLEGEEWEAFKSGIADKKGIKRMPIMYRIISGGIRQGLDGRNRLKACKELGIKPDMIEVHVSDDDVETFIVEQNIRRRHMTGEARKAYVSRLREHGMSERAIAETVGTSQATVHRDIVSTDSNESVESQNKAKSGKSERKSENSVVGKDGKRRKAQVKPRAISAPIGPSDADETRIARTDAEGHDVPDSALEAFAVIDKFTECDKLCRQLQALIADIATVKGGEHLQKLLRLTGSDDKASYRSEHLNNLKRDLKYSRPHSICPWCQAGKKDCKFCNNERWVEKLTWDSADESIKGNLK